MPRVNPVLGLIKEETLLCFGGLEDHQQFLDIEGFNIKVTEK